MKKCFSAASKLDKPVTVEKLTLTQNDSGGQSESWSTLMNLWVSIQPRIGIERFFAMRLEENITHVIKARYFSGLDASMRIKYKNRYFQIHSIINDDEDNQSQTILAIEGVGS